MKSAKQNKEPDRTGPDPAAAAGSKKEGVSMKLLKKGFTGMLVLAFLALSLPRVAFCDGSTLFAKADQKTITRHEPKVMTSPAKAIPLAQGEQGQKSKGSYLWIGLGAVVLLGLVAAGGGGGGGDSGNNGDDTGSITVGW
jgi:hypothetical protein